MKDFLVLVSGDDITALLDEVLSPREKEAVPAILGSKENDESGAKRLAKINSIVRKSPPLKPWTLRGKKDTAVRERN